MTTYIIQHVPFESPGILEKIQNYEMIKMFESFQFPKLEEVDLLIILGGPMGVYDDIEWLQEEKQFIKAVIQHNRAVLGICLGAQLIAESIGGKVMPNPKGKEVGWWPIYKRQDVDALNFLPEKLEVLHWHGDTFTLPEEATTFYSTELCKNQAFLYKNNVVGLQFHFETTKGSLKTMVEADASYISGKGMIQSKEAILAKTPPEENADILLQLIQFIKGN
ncbi:type 1 glutamine amidotransferase [Ureibacillus sp. FSL E2-3493]|uniref:type 1 glutamine amidotransferase n=1 Tax=Ureibacillus sp. FSL E2-3493 TaxID=2921367 RepID=UPI003119AD6D